MQDPGPSQDPAVGAGLPGPTPTKPKTHRMHSVIGSNPFLIAPLVLVIAGIQLAIPEDISLGPYWLIPIVEVIAAPLGLILHKQFEFSRRGFRIGATVYLTFLVGASIANALLLLLTLMERDHDHESGQALLFGGFGVLFVNVLSFALVYWWVDGGGPTKRAAGTVTRWDFQFPQQGPDPTWQPALRDYMFTAYTNAIAFSPTDTMPLTHRIKFLFTVQSGVALVTVLVTVSRAINLIS